MSTNLLHHRGFRNVTILTGLTVLILGGASREWQGLYWVFALIGAIGIFSIFIFSDKLAVKKPFKKMSLFAGALISLITLQFIPLPATIWTRLPDRQNIADGFLALNIELMPLPLTMTPDDSLVSAFAFIFPLFIFAYILRFRNYYKSKEIMWFIPALAMISITIGILQLIFGPDSPLYFFASTNPNLPVGIFANANHHTTLILMALPWVFVSAEQFQRPRSSIKSNHPYWFMLAALTLPLIFVLYSVKSVAGYLLLAPIAFGCYLLPKKSLRKIRLRSRIFIGIAFVIGLATLAITIQTRAPIIDGAFISAESRITIASNTTDIIVNHKALGSGLGSFEEVYKLNETYDGVTRIFINHAHNDYLEWLLETGFLGAILLILFLLWWAQSFIKIWTNEHMSNWRIKRAASLSTLVVVLHSWVDYPLRTPTIAILCAFCFAIMLASKSNNIAVESEKPIRQKNL